MQSLSAATAQVATDTERIMTEIERAQWRRLKRIHSWLRLSDLYRRYALRELAKLDADIAKTGAALAFVFTVPTLALLWLSAAVVDALGVM